MGNSAAIAEKEISNLVTVRTIKCRDVLPGEAMEYVFEKSLGKHLSGTIQS